MTNIGNAKFSTAEMHFAAACRASREHNALAIAAFAEHGDHGSLISGCVREHFPEATKNELRRLAREVTIQSDLAYANRPARVRLWTMHDLATDVATRDGSGYYGPRGRRE